jgi:hypothetical protein
MQFIWIDFLIYGYWINRTNHIHFQFLHLALGQFLHRHVQTSQARKLISSLTIKIQICDMRFVFLLILHGKDFIIYGCWIDLTNHMIF